ncbi:CBO0543 family protein [Marinicrinis lubricantis]|uniref:CBO0543 family protein n=1 Tax=Marinicrinis lubricantis TaxID=2086470 RepID=A0ABW1INB1_9BACL
MSLEWIVITLMWCVGVISVVVCPKQHLRKLLFTMLLCQALTWVTTLIHVYYGLLSFPVREFPKATDLLVTTEYFFYPLICGYYVVYEPSRHVGARMAYLALWVTGLTTIDIVIERYTDLIEYIHYSWYWTWIVFFGLFAITNISCQQFFKSRALFRGEKEVTE